MKPKNERHHWWPRGLSKFWQDDSGHVHCVSCDGELVRSFPKEFGAIRNANKITYAKTPTVWEESFEGTFQLADDNFPNLITWLQGLNSELLATSGPFSSRLTPLIVKQNIQVLMGVCLASLIARSPSFRNRVRLTLERYRSQFDLPDLTADKDLVALNVRRAQHMLAGTMISGGKFTVLLSGAGEFIFGDGFLHNVSSATDHHRPRCLVPLTPEIAIFYTRPMRYRTYPKGFALNLTPEEVSFVNDTVQVYSNRFLFFREIHPVIDPVFTRCEHMQYKYERHSWIDQLEQAMADTFFGFDAEFDASDDGV
ncbi:MAG: hypothetical protein ACFCUW_15695 [Kiloniellaceae bacterium]